MRDAGIVWELEPAYARQFYVFLAIVCVMALVRAVWLARHVSPTPWFNPHRIALQHVIAGTVAADLLARSALANVVYLEVGIEAAHETVDRDAAIRTLRAADTQFSYLWQLAHARVVATRGLLWLTLIVSAMIAFYGAVPEWYDLYNNQNNPGMASLMQAINIVFARFARGLFVCALLGGMCIFFEGRLIRRMAFWKMFHATAMDSLSTLSRD